VPHLGKSVKLLISITRPETCVHVTGNRVGASAAVGAGLIGSWDPHTDCTMTAH